MRRPPHWLLALWLALVPLFAALAASCGEATRPVAQPSGFPTPPPPPHPPGLYLPPGLEPGPTPAPIVTPVAKTQFVFTFPPGPEARLYVYDKPKEEVFAYPGAGKGIDFAFFIGTERFMFQQDRGIHVYDHKLEVNLTIIDPRLVGGFAFEPTTDFANNTYFLGTDDPAKAALGIGDVYGIRTIKQATESLDFPWDPVAKPIFFGPVNAIGALHGGISSVNINGAGDAMVFTTAEGGLYLYNQWTAELYELRTNREFGEGRASSVGIDYPWGRWVCWEDFVLQRIFLLDRWTGLIDTVPNANLALDAVATRFPFFSGYDPWHVFFTAFLPDGSRKLYMYDHRTEWVSNLTLITFFPDATDRR